MLTSRLITTGCFALSLATGCGPDRTIDLLADDGQGGGGASPGQGGGSTTASGQGGAGGAPSPCERHGDCEGHRPWCDGALGGVCTECPEGLARCGAACVDVGRDAAHCGACFAGCALGETCVEGACPCQPGLVRCGEACVAVGREPTHCSGCDHPCPQGTTCDAGQCHEGACGDGFTACAEEGGAEGCFDLLVGPFCGECGLTCGPYEVCVLGSCRAHVPAAPCSMCPCHDVCAASLGEPVSCCEGVHGASTPSCVAGDHCPG